MTDAAMTKLLKQRGWFFVRGAWRHDGFSYGWPTKDAVQLEREADRGEEHACRILQRSTPWPD
jgi:hypothetical protein